MSNVRWMGPYLGTDRFADDVTVADIVRLRKENQELKDYLEQLERYVVFLEAGIIDLEMAGEMGRKINVRTGNSS